MKSELTLRSRAAAASPGHPFCQADKPVFGLCRLAMRCRLATQVLSYTSAVAWETDTISRKCDCGRRVHELFGPEPRVLRCDRRHSSVIRTAVGRFLRHFVADSAARGSSARRGTVEQRARPGAPSNCGTGPRQYIGFAGAVPSNSTSITASRRGRGWRYRPVPSFFTQSGARLGRVSPTPTADWPARKQEGSRDRQRYRNPSMRSVAPRLPRASSPLRWPAFRLP